MNDDGEDRRLKRCPICRAHVGRSDLWELSGRTMCQGCGRDEVNAWNRAMLEDELLDIRKGSHETTDANQGTREPGGQQGGGAHADGLSFLW